MKLFELTFWQAEQLQTWNRDIFVLIVAKLLSWALATFERFVGLYRRTQCAWGLLWAAAVKTNSPNLVEQYRLALDRTAWWKCATITWSDTHTHAHTYTHGSEAVDQELRSLFGPGPVSLWLWKLISCSCLSLVRNLISWIVGINSGSPGFCLGTGCHWWKWYNGWLVKVLPPNIMATGFSIPSQGGLIDLWTDLKPLYRLWKG